MTSPIDQLRDWGLLDIENEKCATSECPCDCHDGYQRQCTCPNPPNLPAIVERLGELEAERDEAQARDAGWESAFNQHCQLAGVTNPASVDDLEAGISHIARTTLHTIKEGEVVVSRDPDNAKLKEDPTP